MFVFRTLEKGQLVDILKGMIEELYAYRGLVGLVDKVLPYYSEELCEYYDCEDVRDGDCTDWWIEQEVIFLLEEDYLDEGLDKFIEFFGEEEVEKAALSYLADRGEL